MELPCVLSLRNELVLTLVECVAPAVVMTVVVVMMMMLVFVVDALEIRYSQMVVVIAQQTRSPVMRWWWWWWSVVAQRIRFPERMMMVLFARKRSQHWVVVRLEL